MTQPALTAIPQHIVSASDYHQQARHHLDDNAWHYLIGGAVMKLPLTPTNTFFSTIY